MLALLWPAAARPQTTDARGLRLTGSISAGFDSFQEKYSIVERDTLDIVNELRTSLAIGLMTGTYLRDFALLEGRVRVSDDSFETGALVRINKLFRSGTSRIGFEGDYKTREFGANTTYQFPNNYRRLFLRGYLRHSLSRSFALRLTDRLEHQDFEKRTEFDYDYLRNKISLDGEMEWNFTTFLDLRIAFSTIDIPDSTEIEYQSLIPSAEFRHFAGLHDRAALLAALERRNYVAGSPRSSFTAVFANFMGEISVSRIFSVLLEDDFEWYEYDFNDPVYFDYVQNLAALLFKLNPTLELSMGLGPTYGVLDSDVSSDDEYTEYGLKLVFDYNSGALAWVSIAYQPGRRMYHSYTESESLQDTPSLFSDYAFHRLSIITNFRVWNGLSFGGFVNFEPEDHVREGDDATATLITLSLFYVF
jgi:hypothetical protein